MSDSPRTHRRRIRELRIAAVTKVVLTQLRLITCRECPFFLNRAVNYMFGPSIFFHALWSFFSARKQKQIINYKTTRTPLSRAHTSAKADNVANLLLLNTYRVTHIFPGSHAVIPPNHNLTQTHTWAGLPPKSNGFFRGPCATFLPNFTTIGWVFCIILQNKLTN